MSNVDLTLPPLLNYLDLNSLKQCPPFKMPELSKWPKSSSNKLITPI